MLLPWCQEAFSGTLLTVRPSLPDWAHVWGPRSQDPLGPVWRSGWPDTGTSHPCDGGIEKKLILSIRGPSSLLPIHQKLPSVCAFFITRVNICHVNKARGCFSPLRNRICNDTAPLMFLSQYNMYLNEDESHPVRAGLRRCTTEGSRDGAGRGSSARGSARQEVGWAPRGELAFCGLHAIPAPERPRRVRVVMESFFCALG